LERLNDVSFDRPPSTGSGNIRLRECMTVVELVETTGKIKTHD